MRFRRVPVLVVSVVLLAGCGEELFAERVLSRWCEASDCGVPTSVTFHGAGEAWLFDRPAARRRAGRWQHQDPCGDLGTPATLGFEGDAVWALCKVGWRRHLVRTAANGAPVRIEVATAPAFVPLVDEVLFAWEDGIFAWDGSTFVLVAPPQPQRLGLFAWGLTRTNFYFEGKHWDGASWQPMDSKSNLSRSVGYARGDAFCADGRFLVQGTTVTDLFVTERALEATGRTSNRLFAAWNCERLWVLSVDTEEAVISRVEAGQLVRVGTLGEPLFRPGPDGLRIAETGVAVAKDRVVVTGLDDVYELHLR